VCPRVIARWAAATRGPDRREKRVAHSSRRHVCIREFEKQRSPRTPKRARGPAVQADLVDRIPDDGEHIVVVLAGGAAKIGVELLGSESRIGEAERHVIFARSLALLDPAGADLDGLAIDAIVRLRVAALARIEQDVDGSAERSVLSWPLKLPSFCFAT
jgi:hypothetical protein